MATLLAQSNFVERRGGLLWLKKMWSWPDDRFRSDLLGKRDTVQLLRTVHGSRAEDYPPLGYAVLTEPQLRGLPHAMNEGRYWATRDPAALASMADENRGSMAIVFAPQGLVAAMAKTRARPAPRSSSGSWWRSRSEIEKALVIGGVAVAVAVGGGLIYYSGRSS